MKTDDLANVYETPTANRKAIPQALPDGVHECRMCGGSGGVPDKPMSTGNYCPMCDGVGYIGLNCGMHDLQPGSPLKLALLAYRYRTGWDAKHCGLFSGLDKRVSHPDPNRMFVVPNEEFHAATDDDDFGVDDFDD